MKTVNTLPLLMLLLMPAAAHADSYKIESVDIYPSGAIIAFSAEFDKKVTVDIPATFNIKSVQMNASKSENISSFSLEEIVTNIDIPAFLLKDKSSLDSIKFDIDKLNSERHALQLSSALLGNVKFENRDVGSIEKSIKELAKQDKEYQQKLQELNAKIEAKTNEYKILEHDINSKMPENQGKKIRITASSNGKSILHFEAANKNVIWKTVYDFVLDVKTGKIATSMFLNISQKTGIDFDKLVTKLHFDNPDAGSIIAELSPLAMGVIDQRTGMPVMTRFKMPEAEEVMELKADESYNPLLFNKTFIGIVLKPNISIASDAISNKVLLDKYVISSKIDIKLLPLHSPYALISTTLNELEKPLLASDASYYIDGNLTYEMSINETMSGKDNYMVFGYTRLISAERKEQIAKSSDGFSKDSKSEGFMIKVINSSDTDQKISLVDRLPISADSRLKVGEVEISPKATSVSDEGIIVWEVDIKKGEKKEFKVTYKLIHPKDTIVVPK